MDITLEKVERLREKAQVSYTQAKEALDYSDGDLLDALIYLEEQGTIPRPEGVYYSTRGETPVTVDEESAQELEQNAAPEPKEQKCFLARARSWLIDNELEIWHRDRPVTAMPALVMILLLVLAAWAVIPLAAVGMLLGYRVRFTGPDSDHDDLEDPENGAVDTPSDLGRRVMDELRRQREQNNSEDKKHDDTEGQGV